MGELFKPFKGQPLTAEEILAGQAGGKSEDKRKDDAIEEARRLLGNPNNRALHEWNESGGKGFED